MGPTVQPVQASTVPTPHFSAPSMSAPQPVVAQQPVPQPTAFMPPASSGQAFQPMAASGYGNQPGYGQSFPSADISHIPKGPAPDRGEMTPGWNDPRNKAEYAQSVDAS